MAFNLIVITAPPFKSFSFIHDKSNEYYKLVHERKFIHKEVEQVSVKLNKQVHQMERIEKIHF